MHTLDRHIQPGDLLLQPNPTAPPALLICRVLRLHSSPPIADFDPLLTVSSISAAYFFRDAEYPSRELWLHEDLRAPHP